MSGLDISVRDLTKRFGDRTILDGLDLHVPAGQFLAIVGRSGCGKSTLLRLLSGLDAPDAGTFAFGPSRASFPPKADVRVMFQEPRLLPWSRVLANVEVGLSGTDVSPKERAARASAALADTNLDGFAGQWPATLSGGQKQRVALARALVSRPRILAFDEPLGALDALTRIEMQSLIERIHRDQKFTAILVTHDVREALTLADRVVMIENGRIALDLDVPLPRPRPRVSTEIAALEEQILSRLLTPAARAA